MGFGLSHKAAGLRSAEFEPPGFSFSSQINTNIHEHEYMYSLLFLFLWRTLAETEDEFGFVP